jgi:transposase-like protein
MLSPTERTRRWQQNSAGSGKRKATSKPSSIFRHSKANSASAILKRCAACANTREHLLTFYAFPQVMHRYIRTTNATPSFFSNVRQRTDQIDTFTTETSCLSIIWAVMQDIGLPKIPVG